MARLSFNFVNRPTIITEYTQTVSIINKTIPAPLFFSMVDNDFQYLFEVYQIVTTISMRMINILNLYYDLYASINAFSS